MKIPTHQNNFQITWADKAAGKEVKDIRTLHISDPPFSLAKGTKPETVFRNSIEIWTGFHKDVMSDLYRHLVLSNSTRLDGKGGATARSNLDAKYPDRQTLPKLKRETGNVNTLGAIISILLEPREMHGEAYADAFSIVGGILASLLQARVFLDEQPRLNLDESPVPPTPKSADLEPQLPGRVRTETYRILRDTELARRVKLRHEYKCQIAGCDFTMQLPNGSGYAEAHHIKPLRSGHQGHLDVIGNILCLCPNHHAELDYGVVAIKLDTLRRIDDHPIDQRFVDYHNDKIHKPGNV